MAVKRRSFKKNIRSGLKKKSRIYRKKSFSKKSRKNNKKSKKSKLRKRNTSRRFNKMIGGAGPTNLEEGTYKFKDNKDKEIKEIKTSEQDGDIKKDNKFFKIEEHNNKFYFQNLRPGQDKNGLFSTPIEAIQELKLYGDNNNPKSITFANFVNEYLEKIIPLNEEEKSEILNFFYENEANMKKTKLDLYDEFAVKIKDPASEWTDKGIPTRNELEVVLSDPTKEKQYQRLLEFVNKKNS